MNLRCWPGCIAYVERAMLPENVGILVEVLKPGPGTYGKPEWFVRSLRPAPSVLDGLGVVVWREMTLVFDAWLRPITPPPGSETESSGEPIKEVA